MPRISSEKLKAIEEAKIIATNRNSKFRRLIESRKSNIDLGKKDPAELHKISALIREMRNNNYGLLDVVMDYTSEALSSSNDTHGFNRKFEKWLGGRGDGKPEPDTNSGEIKLNEVDEQHKLPRKNPVLNIGKIEPKGRKYRCFEESSVFQKMKCMSITTYLRENYSFVDSFVFEVENPKWFHRVKEDYEFYLGHYHDCIRSGVRSSNSSIVSSRIKSPNQTLQVRTDSIMITSNFFEEISRYYGI
jgi:hypothetical protein